VQARIPGAAPDQLAGLFGDKAIIAKVRATLPTMTRP